MTLVTTTDQFEQIRREILDSKIVAVDSETSFSETLFDRKILGLAVTTINNSWYIPVGHESFMGSEPNNLFIPNDLFKGYDGVLVAHNMKFDYIVLQQASTQVSAENLWCTMMLSVYIDENHIPGHDLDTVLKTYLGEQKKKVEREALVKFGWTKSPPAYMAEYAEQDCKVLPELYEVLRSKSQDRHLELWSTVDRPFMLLLAKLEMQGIRINRELCADLEAQCLLRLEDIRQELGFDPAKPSELHPKLFSEPPFGLGLDVPSLTPKGKPQVSLDWLAGIGHPRTALIHEYRKTSKQLSSYFSAYLNLTTRDKPTFAPKFQAAWHGDRPSFVREPQPPTDTEGRVQGCIRQETISP